MFYKYLAKREKEALAEQIRNEFERMKNKIDFDPNQITAKLNEMKLSNYPANEKTKIT